MYDLPPPFFKTFSIFSLEKKQNFDKTSFVNFRLKKKKEKKKKTLWGSHLNLTLTLTSVDLY